MKSPCALLILAGAISAAGCAKPTGPPPPLSVADWKTLPVDRKYTSEALERLKEGDPRLQTAEGWAVFSRTVLAESRKKDFAAGKRRL